MMESQELSLIHLTPFSDTNLLNENGSAGPFCYLLEIDQAKILLDCGCKINENGLSFDHLNPLKQIIREIDAIIITHASLEHCGGLPFLFAHALTTSSNASTTNSFPRIYMTVASATMCQILFTDVVSSWINSSRQTSVSSISSSRYHLQSSFLDGYGYTTSTIKNLMADVTGLRYSQPIHLPGKADGIVLTAFPAGHSLGGAYWKLRKGMEDLVYAVHIHHKKERHLDASTLLALSKPSVMITDAVNALSVQYNRKHRDSEFIDTIISHLRHQQGNVLIPLNPVGRVLEILLLLESAWTLHKFPYPIYFVSQTGFRLLEYVKSMMEWMGESILKSFGANRENPFDFKYIKIVSSLQEAQSLISPCNTGEKMTSSSELPRVILTTFGALEFGYARSFFRRWMEKSNSLIIFITLNPPLGTLAHQLLQISSANGSGKDKSTILKFKIEEPVPLEGEDLEKFENAKSLRQQQSLAPEKAFHDLRKTEKKRGGRSSFLEPSSLLLSGDVEIDEDSHMIDAHEEEERRLRLIEAEERGSSSESETETVEVFPFVEKKKNLTPYGEELDPKEWPVFSFQDGDDMPVDGIDDQVSPKIDVTMKESSVLPGGLEEALFSLQKLSKEESSSLPSGLSNAYLTGFPGKGKKDDFSLPFKISEELVEGPVQCSIKWMDFDGLTDGRSLKTMIGQIRPRKLVLVNGSFSALQYLAQSCRLALSSAHTAPARTGLNISTSTELNDVLIANKPFERINISRLTNMFQLKLSDSLISKLNVKMKDDILLARVEGAIITVNHTEKERTDPSSPSLLEEKDKIMTDMTGGIMETDKSVEVQEKVEDKLRKGESEVPSFVPTSLPILESIDKLEFQEGKTKDYLQLCHQSLLLNVGDEEEEHGLTSNNNGPLQRKAVEKEKAMFKPDKNVYHERMKLKSEYLIGEIRLMELKKKFMNEYGYNCDLTHGQLFIREGPLMIRKDRNNPSELILEGNVCKDYSKIRQILYDQFVRI